jgi:hypothetical protein
VNASEPPVCRTEVVGAVLFISSICEVRFGSKLPLASRIVSTAPTGVSSAALSEGLLRSAMKMASLRVSPRAAVSVERM